MVLRGQCEGHHRRKMDDVVEVGDCFGVLCDLIYDVLLLEDMIRSRREEMKESI